MPSDLLQKTIKYLFKVADHYTKVNTPLPFISGRAIKYLLLLRICILLYSLGSTLCQATFNQNNLFASIICHYRKHVRHLFFLGFFHIKSCNIKNFSIMRENTLEFSRIVQKELWSSLPEPAHSYCPILSLFSHSHCCYPYGMVSISEDYSWPD